MGGIAIASAATNSLMDESVNIMNTFAQTCTVKTSRDVDLDFGKGCTVTNGTFNFNDNVTVSQECIQKSTVTATIKSVMRTKIQQKAQSIAQTLGIGISASSSYIEQAGILADDITNHFTQTCVISNKNTFKLVCEGAKITNITINNNSDGQYGQNCRGSYNINIDLKQRLENSIIQSSSAAVRADAMIVILIFIGFIFTIIIYYSFQELEGPIGWLIVFLILGSLLSGIIYSYFAPQKNIILIIMLKTLHFRQVGLPFPSPSSKASGRFLKLMAKPCFY